MPTPGEAGPAVLLGHKDTRTRSAVFTRLPEIRNGDVIEVKRQDGITAVFTVGGIEQAGKTTFPTERVYGQPDQRPAPPDHLRWRLQPQRPGTTPTTSSSTRR